MINNLTKIGILTLTGLVGLGAVTYTSSIRKSLTDHSWGEHTVIIYGEENNPQLKKLQEKYESKGLSQDCPSISLKYLDRQARCDLLTMKRASLITIGNIAEDFARELKKEAESLGLNTITLDDNQEFKDYYRVIAYRPGSNVTLDEAKRIAPKLQSINPIVGLFPMSEVPEEILIELKNITPKEQNVLAINYLTKEELEKVEKILKANDLEVYQTKQE